MYQFFDLSSFAEQLLVHENMLVKIRPDMPLDKAALIGCGVTTGVGAVLNTAQGAAGRAGRGHRLRRHRAQRDPGRRARRRRARRSRWTASRRSSQLATEFGATDVVERVRGRPGHGGAASSPVGGVDHAFEAIGLKATAEQAFTMLRKGGTATVIGMIPFGEKVEIDGFQLLLEKKLQGSNMGSNRFRVDMPQYIEWYLNGKLKLDELVSADDPARPDQRGLRRAARAARSPVSSSASTDAPPDRERRRRKRVVSARVGNSGCVATGEAEAIGGRYVLGAGHRQRRDGRGAQRPTTCGSGRAVAVKLLHASLAERPEFAAPLRRGGAEPRPA